MASFTLSPGVTWTETDNSQVAQAQDSLAFGFSGRFSWGPVDQIMTVSNPDELLQIFGKPDNSDVAVDFLCAERFLGYSSALRVVRAGDASKMKNAQAGSGTIPTILNDDDFDATTGLTSKLWIAKYPGEAGNSIGVSTCVSASDYSETLPGTFAVKRGSKQVEYTASADEALEDFFTVGDYLNVDGTRYGVSAIDSENDTLTLTRAYAGVSSPTTFARDWRFSSRFASAPAENKLHIVLTDEGGFFTGEPGKLLEVFESLETADKNAKYSDGTAAYFQTAINRRSQYIRVGGADISSDTTNGTLTRLSGGVSGYSSLADDAYDSLLIDGFNHFSNAEKVDIRGIFVGPASPVVSSYVTENICEIRRDCGSFSSPRFNDVVNNKHNEVSATIATRKELPYSSYGVYDCNWMKVLDRYNDTYRWIPCNASTAGCLARAIRDQGVGYSPAGDDSGQIKDVIKLAWSPNKTERDDLYVQGINPIADFEGKGPLLYGDRTLLGDVGSGFRQIGFRWLFIHIEKTISKASTSVLFKFNDDVTRAHFVSLVDPILRRLKGSRVVVRYKITVDESVNTDAVVNAEEFVGVIEVQGARSINGVRLDFVATKAGAEFTESNNNN